jgi:hypothetical protein
VDVSYGQSKVERINPDRRARVNERTAVDPAVFLFESKGTGAMPTGLFKALDHSVQVDYDGVSIPIPRSTYEKNGYKPDFDSLPLQAEYRAAKEKLGNVPRL